MQHQHFSIVQLLAPYLPQMADDGLISDADLQQDNFIFAEVVYYSNIAVGDEIRFYFSGRLEGFKLIEEPNDNTFPVIFSVSALSLSDGVYPTYYTVTDNAGNISFSSTSYAILFRGGAGTLPAPVFVDAVNDELSRETILAKGGTDIRIPAYPDMQAGDTITLSFYINDKESNYVPESQYTWVRDVTDADVSQGIVHLVPERFLLVVNEGFSFARYSVTADNGSIQVSAVALAHLLNHTESLLPPPIFVDGGDDLLTQEEVSEGVRVSVAYSGMAEDDDVRIFLRGHANPENGGRDATDEIRLTLSLAQAIAGQVIGTFPATLPAAVIAGRLNCDYQVIRPDEERLSAVASVFLDTSVGGTSLPAPVFTSAIDSVLESDVVELEQGTPLRISYQSIQQSDDITVFLSGTDANGTPVNEAEFITLHTVTAQEQNAGFLSIHLPESNLLAVGDRGTLRANYAVLPSGQSSSYYSLNSKVLMKYSTIEPSGVNTILTLNAPPSDQNVINLTPYNRGRVSGQPGSAIRIVTSPEVTIQESGASEYEFRLDADGLGSFRLFSHASGGYQIATINMDNPAEQIDGNVVFSDYRLGSGDIKFIASTTGAVADGIMPCSIYLMTAPSTFNRIDITHVRVTIVNSATAQITGYPGMSSAEIPLRSDKSVEVDITNTVAESITVQITLPESSGTEERMTMLFLADGRDI